MATQPSNEPFNPEAALLGACVSVAVVGGCRCGGYCSRRGSCGPSARDDGKHAFTPIPLSEALKKHDALIAARLAHPLATSDPLLTFSCFFLFHFCFLTPAPSLPRCLRPQSAH